MYFPRVRVISIRFACQRDDIKKESREHVLLELIVGEHYSLSDAEVGLSWVSTIRLCKKTHLEIKLN